MISFADHLAVGRARPRVQDGQGQQPAIPLILRRYSTAVSSPTESCAAVRWFATTSRYMMMNTLRGLLLKHAIGNDAWVACAWCVAITVAGFVWATRLYNRDPSR
jgi:ABC-2 type transport system permease protein